MSCETYFIRRRGRVDGPFDPVELEKMARRGTLSTIDEVSQDGRVWLPAATLGWLFQTVSVPEASSRAPTSATMEPVADLAEPGAAPAAPGPPKAPSEKQYYYFQGGRVVGPLSAEALRSLAVNNTLKPDDLVWAADDQTSLPAGQAAVLSSVYHQDQPLPEPPFVATNEWTPATSAPQARTRTEHILQRMNRLSLAGGLSGSVLLLFCLNTPLGRRAEGLQWWWHLAGQPGMGFALLYCFFVLFIGLSLLFVAPMLKGAPRAWTYVSMAALGLPLLIAYGVVTKAPSPLVLLPMLVPPFWMASLISTLCYRTLAARALNGWGFQAVAGGCTSLTALIVAILGIWSFPFLGSDAGRAAAVVVTVLATMGHLCGLGCGILAIITSRPVLSRQLALAAIILAMVGMALLAIAGSVIGYANAGATPDGSRFMLVQALRLVVMANTLAFLGAIGLSDLLVWAGFARQRRH